jgi:O-antigen ligase
VQDFPFLTNATAKSVTVLCGLFFLIGPMAAVARQGLVPLLFAVLLTLCVRPEARAAWRGLPKAPLVVFAAPLVLWSLISNLWAPAPQWGSWLQTIVTILGGVLVCTGIRSLGTDAARRLLKAALFGAAVLLAFLLEEGITDAAVLSWVRPNDVQSSDALFFSLILSLAARGTAVLAIIGVTMAVAIYIFTRSIWLSVLFFAAALAACLRLPMTTSALGLALSGAVAACVYWRPKLFAGLLWAALAVVVLAAGPAAQLIPEAADRTPAENQLELGVQHRLDVWRYVANISAERFVIGHGFNASRHFAARQDKIAHSGLPALPTHPHNAPLQLWLELGGIGAVLTAFLFFGVWRAVQTALQSRTTSAVIAGLVTPAAVIACFSFSVWSTWWLAALGLAAALVGLANKLSDAEAVP